MEKETIAELQERVKALEELSDLLLTENVEYKKLLETVFRKYPEGKPPASRRWIV